MMRSQPAADQVVADGSADSSGGRGQRVKPSRLRRWLYRFIAMVVLPLLVLALVELGLRIGGVGYATTFFSPIPGTDAYTVNPRFGWRFFPRDVSRQAWSFYLPKHKAPGVYRIFVLGGSAAQGVPDPGFSFARFLEVMLAETYPETTFEVVNTAMTAINSHVVVPIARDCAEHEPDLLIVYMGNNEVTGPFGVGTVFDTFTPSMKLIRASLAVKTTRLGQLAASVIKSLAGDDAPTYWGGMEMFQGNRVTADDARLEKLYDHFRRNLEDIRHAGSDAGAAVIVCTVASNLTDCPPFASAHRGDLSEAQQTEWTTAVEAGIRCDQAGDAEGAVNHYLAALKIDDTHGELHFRLGQSYLTLGRDAVAREAFIRARDLDTLRFRTDSKLNQVIRDVAGEASGGRVALVDAERLLGSGGEGAALPGSDLFYEHVHLTLQGNYELARAIFPRVVEALSATIQADGPAPAPPSMARCAERLALTPWQRVEMLSYMVGMMGRPPFTGQLDNARRQARMQAAADAMAAQLGPEAVGQAKRRFRDALALAPEDVLIRRSAGRFFMFTGMLAEAEEHLRFVADRLPTDSAGHFELASLLLAQGRTFEANESLAQSIEVAADKAQVHARIAELQLTRRQIGEAAKHCRLSLDIRPNDPKMQATMGFIHVVRGEYAEAIPLLTRSIELSPGNAPTHQDLGVALVQSGRSDEGLEQLAKAVELAPKLLPARKYYALELTRRGQLAQAAAEYDQAARCVLETVEDPRGPGAAEAIGLAERAVELDEREDPALLRTLAAAYAKGDQISRALTVARDALTLARAQERDDLIQSLRDDLARYEAAPSHP